MLFRSEMAGASRRARGAQKKAMPPTVNGPVGRANVLEARAQKVILPMASARRARVARKVRKAKVRRAVTAGLMMPGQARTQATVNAPRRRARAAVRRVIEPERPPLRISPKKPRWKASNLTRLALTRRRRKEAIKGKADARVMHARKRRMQSSSADWSPL